MARPQAEAIVVGAAHPASLASDVKSNELINNVRPMGSLRSAARTTILLACSGQQVRRRGSHARLTLHAASALKPQSPQGRGIEENLTTESTEDTKGGEGDF